MIVSVSPEFRSICPAIIAEGKSLVDWRAMESDDMFQSEQFCGGFESIEDAFCFSYYEKAGREFWVQITLDEAAAISSQKIKIITVRPADK